MQNLEQKDEMLVLLQELREDQKYLRSKQDELAQKMTKTDQTIRRMNEQATQATDEDLLGLNLEDVVEKLQPDGVTFDNIRDIVRQTSAKDSLESRITKKARIIAGILDMDQDGVIQPDEVQELKSRIYSVTSDEDERRVVSKYLSSTAVLNDLKELVQTLKERRSQYGSCMIYVLFFFLYLIVLLQQQQGSVSWTDANPSFKIDQAMRTTVVNNLPADGAAQTETELFDWFRKSFVGDGNAFTDYNCGDGNCEKPLEYEPLSMYRAVPGMSQDPFNQSCAKDCTTWHKETDFIIDVNVSLLSDSGVHKPDPKLYKQVQWNLVCPSIKKKNLNLELFPDSHKILGKQFDVPPRNAVSQKVSLIDCEEWQLRVRAPPGTYVSGSVRSFAFEEGTATILKSNHTSVRNLNLKEPSKKKNPAGVEWPGCLRSERYLGGNLIDTKTGKPIEADKIYSMHVCPKMNYTFADVEKFTKPSVKAPVVDYLAEELAKLVGSPEVQLGHRRDGFSVELFTTSNCTGPKLTYDSSACLPNTTTVRSVRVNNPLNKKLYARLLSTCDNSTSLGYKTWTFDVDNTPPPAPPKKAPIKTQSALKFQVVLSPDGKDAKWDLMPSGPSPKTPKPAPTPAPASGSSKDTSDVDTSVGSCIAIDTSVDVYAADTVKPKEFVIPSVKRFNFDSTCIDCGGLNCSGADNLVGDGTCHNGTDSTDLNFACLKFEFDRGDCEQRYQFTPRRLVIQNVEVPALAPQNSICAAYGDTCFCNGRVRYGNGKVWTQWRSVQTSKVGYFTCKETAFNFKKDDQVVKLTRRAVMNTIPKHNATNPIICQCATSQPVAPCAREGEVCDCNGNIQYFTPKSVSGMKPSSGHTPCTKSFFYNGQRSSTVSGHGHCACIPKSCRTSANCGDDYWCQTNEGLTLTTGASCPPGTSCYCTGRITKVPEVKDYKLQLQKFAFPDPGLGQVADQKCLKVAIKARTDSESEDDLTKIVKFIDTSSRIFSKRKVDLTSVTSITETLYARVTPGRRRLSTDCVSEQAAAKALGYTQITWDDESQNEKQPSHTDNSWSDMTVKEKALLKVLGYTAKTWDNVSGKEEQPAAASTIWDDLSVCAAADTTTAAAGTTTAAAGTTTAAAGCVSEQTAAKALGYTQVSWDDESQNEKQPSHTDNSWSDMTVQEKALLKILGYTAKTWDNVSGKEEQPAAASTAWDDLSVCGDTKTTATRKVTTKPAGTSASGCVSEQAAAKALGYTQVSWDDESQNERQPSFAAKSWSQLTVQEKALLEILGYTAKTWDNVSGKEEQPASASKFWSDLIVCGNEGAQKPAECKSEQEAAKAVGYTKVSWDNVSGNENQPSIVELYWRAMTNEQKASLTVLGFTARTWDNESDNEEQPTSMDKAWKKLSVCGNAGAQKSADNFCKDVDIANLSPKDRTILGLSHGSWASVNSCNEIARQSNCEPQLAMDLCPVTCKAGCAQDMCVNTNNGKASSMGDFCRSYSNSEEDIRFNGKIPCGEGDDKVFSSEKMCCACGGGKTLGKASISQEEILYDTQATFSRYAKTCVKGINFCVMTGFITVELMVDPISRVDVVTMLLIRFTLPDIKLLSESRITTLKKFVVSEIPDLDASQVFVLPIVTPLTNRRLSTSNKTSPVVETSYLLGANLKRYPVCSDGKLTCDFMTQTAECGCKGEQKINCQRLLDEKCVQELNCEKYFFDAGQCTVRDCNEEKIAKSSLASRLGDGYCDDRFNCQKLGYDWGDCTIVKDCDDVEFYSVDVAWLLGDGECHTGQGHYPHLACERFEYDEGDCKKPVVTTKCMSHDYCDSAAPFCSIRMCDNNEETCNPGSCTQCSACTACTNGIDGTCGPACSKEQERLKCKIEKQIHDCEGRFCPQKYFGDNVCDNGEQKAERQTCNFDCPELINDGGDCLDGPRKGGPGTDPLALKKIEFYPFGDQICHTSALGACTFDLLNNNRCDPVCQFEQCDWDYFDCCRASFVSEDMNTTLLSFKLEAYNISDDSNPFPLASAEVQRFATHGKNALLGGIMMRQKRQLMQSCNDETFPHLQCVAGADDAIETDAFGADPVFLNASKLFSSEMAEHVHICYENDTRVMNTEIKLPYGFHFMPYESIDSIPGRRAYDKIAGVSSRVEELMRGDTVKLPGGLCQEGGKDYFNLNENNIKAGFYPVFFDNKFSQETVSELLTYLEEGFFISSTTSNIEVEFLAYNPEENIYTMVLVTFTFEETGTLSVESIVKQFATSRYDFNVERVRVRLVFEVLFVVLFLYQIYIEINELVVLGHNWPQYFMSGSNLLDIFSIVLIALQVYQWVYITVATNAFTAIAKSSFDIYSPIPSCQRGRRLYYNLTALTEVQFMYDAARTIVGDTNLGMFGEFYMLACFSMLIMLIRTFKQLDFQPRLSLITRTLVDAFWDLVHFFILLLLILLPYAFMGNIFYGQTKSEMATFPDAAFTLFQFLVGEVGPYTGGPGAVHPVVHHIYFISYVFINVWIMLNVLVGILVDSYLKVKQASVNAPTIFHEARDLLMQNLKRLRHSAQKYPDQYVEHEKLVELLDLWLDTKKKEEEEIINAKKGRRISIEGDFTMDRMDLHRIIRAHNAKMGYDIQDERTDNSKIDIAVNTLISHFGKRPKSGLNTKVCCQAPGATSRVKPMGPFFDDALSSTITPTRRQRNSSGRENKTTVISVVAGM